jgi:hypothetical protein
MRSLGALQRRPTPWLLGIRILLRPIVSFSSTKDDATLLCVKQPPPVVAVVVYWRSATGCLCSHVRTLSAEHTHFTSTHI